MYPRNGQGGPGDCSSSEVNESDEEMRKQPVSDKKHAYLMPTEQQKSFS